MRAHAWIQAIRLRTLPLAMGGIIAGSALAYFIDRFNWHIFIGATSTALLLQVLSNLANDLGDHLHGTDNAHREGPERAVQSGAISPGNMKNAMIVCASLAFISGVVTLFLAFGPSLLMLLFLLTGIGALIAAVRYTYGSDPYGYAGLGDVAVMIFFGLVAITGTFVLHASWFWAPTLLPALAFGAFSTAVLNTNNMRDLENDRSSGKRTIAVKLGLQRARRYQAFLILTGLIALIAFTLVAFQSPAQWGFIVSAPLFAQHLRAIFDAADASAFDKQLRVVALTTFLCALTFSAGLVLS